nr:unnamed protein product [Ipomoea batatas]GMC96373.1 unnamed protein product [Ipomoea batatas]GMC96375.1 unnamed protein product [Ipomoea batatas]GMC98539.1 unnamed protein product [Ipomoea batatas]GMD02271.1 unnamed protein product [Ipomoea batatas]
MYSSDPNSSLSYSVWMYPVDRAQRRSPSSFSPLVEQGCGKLGGMARDRTVSSYQFFVLQSPVVSVWDCIVRKMRYSYRPEWV